MIYTVVGGIIEINLPEIDTTLYIYKMPGISMEKKILYLKYYKFMNLRKICF